MDDMGGYRGDCGGDCASSARSPFPTCSFQNTLIAGPPCDARRQISNVSHFRGDRVAYPGLKDVTFFNVVLALVTGFQTALLGAFVGAILSRKRTAKA